MLGCGNAGGALFSRLRFCTDVVFLLLDFDWRPRIRVANLQMRTLKVEVEEGSM